MLTFKLPHTLDLAHIAKIICATSVCIFAPGCDKNTTKDDVAEDITDQAGAAAAKGDQGVEKQAPDDEEPEIPHITESPAILEVMFLPTGSPPMELNTLARAMPKVSPDAWTPPQRKLATSVNNLWKRALSEEGRLLMFNMKEAVTFEVKDELEDNPMVTKTLEPGEDQGLLLSTCENLSITDSALCVDECCYFRLLGGTTESTHSQLMLGKACFDLSDDTGDSYPLVKVSAYVDQCDAGIIEEINP